ncbi:hypothetical protein ES288_D11G189500v1 [Gossypium darwinii]|uniref:Uncharacterized protein n=1 Tax=Gossypium darwinii TaxID=34276 RepID=A0A5D2ALD7_GOSDA|nr:hypothetical protein ES288_D11G189500v1 [Gossypium darwinii]
MSYRQRGNRRPSYYRQRITHPKPEPLPTWEKKFYIEVGAMPCERFVEAKKNLYENDKEIYHGFPCENKLPSNVADLYIDNINCNSEIDSELFSEIKSLTDNENEEKDNTKEIDWFSIPLEEIQATG